MWADLADIKLKFLAQSQLPYKPGNASKPVLQFILNVSSEYYLKAELIHPVRYTYTANVDGALEKTLLLEKIDTGKSKSHELLWLDWENKQTLLFEVPENKSQTGEPYDNDEKGQTSIAKIFHHFPLLESQLSDLVFDELGDSLTPANVLDPLSLIYFLRSISLTEAREIPIVVTDDIRNYRIEPMDKEVLYLNGQTFQSQKYKIQTNEKKEKFYYVWFSDDGKKLPLRFVMDAPLGHLTIDLIKIE